MYISLWGIGFLASLMIGFYKGAPFKGFFAGFFLSWVGAFLMLFVHNANDNKS